MLSVKQIEQINISLLNKSNRLEEFEKEEIFWKYLAKNNLALFYINKVSGNKDLKHALAQKILENSRQYEAIFKKTLLFLENISKDNDLQFMLFKTLREFGEVPDGDIDIIVKRKDYDTWIKTLETEGFNCTIESNFKAKCEKENYMKIEPRINISSYGKILLAEEEVWKYTEKIELYKKEFLKSSTELDLYKLLLNTLYGPKYIRLYEQKLLLNAGIKKVLSINADGKTAGDLKLIINILSSIDIEKTSFPYFLKNATYLNFFIRRVLPSASFNMTTKLRQLLFFFYMKYKYLIFGKLVFEHKWY